MSEEKLSFILSNDSLKKEVETMTKEIDRYKGELEQQRKQLEQSILANSGVLEQVESDKIAIEKMISEKDVLKQNLVEISGEKNMLEMKVVHLLSDNDIRETDYDESFKLLDLMIYNLKHEVQILREFKEESLKVNDQLSERISILEVESSEKISLLINENNVVVEKLKKDIQSHITEENNTESENELLKSEIVKLQEQIFHIASESKTSSEQLNEDKKSLYLSKTKLEVELESSKAYNLEIINHLEQTKRESELILKEKFSLAESLGHEIDSLTQENESLKMSINELKESVESANYESSASEKTIASLHILQTENLALKNEIETFHHERDNIQSKLDDAITEQSVLLEERQLLKSNEKNLENNLTSVIAEKEQLNELLSEKQRFLTDLQEDIAKCNSSNEVMKDKVLNLEMQINMTEAANEDLMKYKNETTLQLTQIERETAEKEAHVEILIEQVRGLESKLADQKLMAEHQHSNSSLKDDKIRSLVENLQEVENLNENISGEKISLQKSFDEMLANSKVVEEELVTCKKSLENKELQFRKAIATIKKLKSQSQEQAKQLELKENDDAETAELRLQFQKYENENRQLKESYIHKEEMLEQLRREIDDFVAKCSDLGNERDMLQIELANLKEKDLLLEKEKSFVEERLLGSNSQEAASEAQLKEQLLKCEASLSSVTTECEKYRANNALGEMDMALMTEQIEDNQRKITELVQQNADLMGSYSANQDKLLEKDTTIEKLTDSNSYLNEMLLHIKKELEEKKNQLDAYHSDVHMLSAQNSELKSREEILVTSDREGKAMITKLQSHITEISESAKNLQSLIKLDEKQLDIDITMLITYTEEKLREMLHQTHEQTGVINEQKGQLNSLMIEATAKDENIQTLDLRVDMLNEQAESLQELNGRLHDQVAAMLQDTAEKDAIIEEFRAKLNESEEKLNLLATTLEGKDKILLELRENIEKLGMDKLDLGSKCESLYREIESLKSLVNEGSSTVVGLQKQIDQTNIEILKKDTDLDRLVRDCSEKESEINSLKAERVASQDLVIDNNRLNALISTLKTELVLSQEDLLKLGNERAALMTNMVELESSKNILVEDCDSYKLKFDVLEHEKSLLKVQLEQSQLDISKLTDNTNLLMQELDTLRERYEETCLSLENTRVESMKSMEELNVIRQKHDEIRLDMTNVVKERDALLITIEELRESVSMKIALEEAKVEGWEVPDINVDVEHLRQSGDNVSQLETQLDDQRQYIEKLIKENYELETRLEVSDTKSQKLLMKLKNLKEKHDGLEKVVEQHKGVDVEFQELQQKANLYKMEMDRLSGIEKRYHLSQEQCNKETSKINEIAKHYQDEINKLQKKIDENDDKLKAVYAEHDIAVTELQNNCDIMCMNIETKLKTNVDLLNEEITVLTAEKDEKFIEVDSLKRQIDEISNTKDREINSLKSELEIIEKTKMQLKYDIETVKNECHVKHGNVESKLKSMQEQYDLLFVDIEHYQELLEKQQSSNLNLQKKLKELESSKSGMETLECQDSRKKLSDAESELEKMKFTMEIADQKFNLVNAEVTNLQIENAKLRQEGGDERRKIVPSRQESAHTTDSEETDDERSPILEKMEETVQELLAVKHDKNHLEDEICGLKWKLEELVSVEEDLESVRNDLFKSITVNETLKKQVIDMNSKLERFSDSETMVEDLKIQVNQLREEKSILQQELSASKLKVESVQGLENEFTELTATCDDLIKDKTLLAKQLNDAHARLISEAAVDKSSVNQLEHLTNENSSLSARVESLEEQLKNATVDSMDLKANLLKAQGEMEQMTFDNITLKSQVDVLSTGSDKLIQFTSDYEQLKSQFSEAIEQKNAVQFELNQSLHSIQQRETRCQQLALQVSQLAEDRSYLNKELASLSLQLRETEQEMLTVKKENEQIMLSNSQLSLAMLEKSTEYERLQTSQHSSQGHLSGSMSDSVSDEEKLSGRLTELRETIVEMNSNMEKMEKNLNEERATREECERRLEEEGTARRGLQEEVARLMEALSRLSGQEFRVEIPDDTSAIIPTKPALYRQASGYCSRLSRWTRVKRRQFDRITRIRPRLLTVMRLYVVFLHLAIAACFFGFL